MIVVLLIWLLWCLLNLLLMFIHAPNVPAHTGFRIVMPESLHNVLSDEEYRAVFMHELGHMHHRHVWRNYLRVCVFWFPSKKRLACQELEADDYAMSQGCGPELASALRKLATARTDIQRAVQLEEKQGSQDASNPTGQGLSGTSKEKQNEIE